MAFLAALPEIAEAAGGAAEAGGAAGGAAEGASGGGGPMSRLGNLFKPSPKPGPGEQNKQQNVGASRTFNFQDAATTARSSFRGGGVD